MRPIKDWAEDDKPREKFVQKGKASLSNAELIAILIRTGSSKKNAVDVGRSVLNEAGDDLNKLAKMSVKELCKTEGIGFVKAISILAALELGGRREASEARQRAQISTSREAHAYIKWRLEDLDHEEFWLLTLDRSNKVLSEFRVSEGGVSATVVDPKKVLRKALEDQASAIILCHNHPSGNLKPSQQDIALTNKIRQACSFLDIALLDHIIVGEKGFFSFGDEGLTVR